MVGQAAFFGYILSDDAVFEFRLIFLKLAACGESAEGMISQISFVT